MLKKQAKFSISILLLGCMLGMADPAGAATITVTANAPDVLDAAPGTGNSSCSLREVIMNLNAGADTYVDCTHTGAAYGTADTITLPAGTYTNAITGFDNLNAKGDLDIAKSVIINGPAFTPPATPSAIIDGGGVTVGRVLHLGTPGITVSINNVTIQNGNATVGGGGGDGIFSAATLSINNSIIQNNGTSGDGGGIYCWSGSVTVDNTTISGNGSGSGGGVYLKSGSCTGGLTVRNNSHIDNNTANAVGAGGGGILTFSDPVTITNSTVSNNTSGTNGGGIGVFSSTGTLTITSSTINGNTGIVGGGINTQGNATIHSSTISNNTAGNFGGGIEAGTQPRTLIIDDSIGTGSTISGNTAGLSGGGIASFFSTATTINATTISGNTTTTGSGGGISSNGLLTVTNSTISGNTAPGTSGSGGGIFNTDSTAKISNTTISGNTATSSGGGINHRFGFAGGILDLTNSTVSGNSATAGSGGGIIANSTLNITNSTITKNSATNVGGGINVVGTVNLKNTIVANQTLGADCSGVPLTSSLNDLDSDGSCGVATTAANALLGPLAANGSPILSFTHTLLTGSPAFDIGDAVTCADAATVNSLDQRGLPRPQGVGCDIGAVEANHQPQPTAPDILNLNLNLNAGNPGTSQVSHHDPDTVNPGNIWVYSVRQRQQMAQRQ